MGCGGDEEYHCLLYGALLTLMHVKKPVLESDDGISGFNGNLDGSPVLLLNDCSAIED